LRNFALMNKNDQSKTAIIIRFALLGVIWLVLVPPIILRTEKFTLYQAFVIVASGIIVFVPMYKKYLGNDGKH